MEEYIVILKIDEFNHFVYGLKCTFTKQKPPPDGDAAHCSVRYRGGATLSLALESTDGIHASTPSSFRSLGCT